MTENVRPGEGLSAYSMVFVFSPDLRDVLLLRKPDDHHNELFRGMWTVPGGRQEPREGPLQCAVRELAEETGVRVRPSRLTFILKFSCNCDSSEAEHFIHVYAASATIRTLRSARGSSREPVKLVNRLWDMPAETVWWLAPLMELTVGRLKQPHCRQEQADAQSKSRVRPI